jgi:hypothetical protein
VKSKKKKMKAKELEKKQKLLLLMMNNIKMNPNFNKLIMTLEDLLLLEKIISLFLLFKKKIKNKMI